MKIFIRKSVFNGSPASLLLCLYPFRCQSITSCGSVDIIQRVWEGIFQLICEYLLHIIRIQGPAFKINMQLLRVYFHMQLLPYLAAASSLNQVVCSCSIKQSLHTCVVIPHRYLWLSASELGCLTAQSTKSAQDQRKVVDLIDTLTTVTVSNYDQKGLGSHTVNCNQSLSQARLKRCTF